MNKNYTIISELDSKLEIEDDNLIIVEDSEDTKQSTVLELKKCFSGDYRDPSDKTFYSSKKIEEILDNLQRELSTLASDSEVQSIQRRVEDIIASNGTGKDSEIVDARDGEKTLHTRLERDINYTENKYMKKIRKVIEDSSISIDHTGYVDLYLKNAHRLPANIIFDSRNLFDPTLNQNTDEVSFTATGFYYTQKNNITEINILLPKKLSKGEYFFFAHIVYGNDFRDSGNIKLAIKNSDDDSAYTEFEYPQTDKFKFNAPKTFNIIKLIFNKENYIANSTCLFTKIMLTTREEYGNTFIPYKHIEVPVEYNETLYNYYIDNYDITCSDKNVIIGMEYYENNITTESIQNDIDQLKSVLIDKRDKCGLIENYGEYLFFDNAICETPTSCRLSYDDKYMRNGVPSLKMQFAEDVNVNPIFTLELNEYIQNIDSVSLVFYIDKTTSIYFATETPITVYLCSDNYTEPEMVNYVKIQLNKSELVQGWNIIKRNINDFISVGSPNIHAIKYVKIEIEKNTSLDNKYMYFNSIIFNQKLKPTVLLAFDGIYEDGLTYTYPYLTTRGIPATIFSNDRSTFTNNVLESIVDLRVKHGWDLGQYGCNPNRERMTHDDNAREQYKLLKSTKSWLMDNIIYNPISYSAPYGNLRPISVPILKDLGYKISKSESTGYCNFFDPKYDFTVPMVKMSNETSDTEIIEKLQYAIDNNACICIYTNNVTDYGDESSAKKTLFEKVIKFIMANDITPMTFEEFYNKCNS